MHIFSQPGKSLLEVPCKSERLRWLIVSFGLELRRRDRENTLADEEENDTLLPMDG